MTSRAPAPSATSPARACHRPAARQWSAGLQDLANQLLQLDEGKGLSQHGQSRLLQKTMQLGRPRASRDEDDLLGQAVQSLPQRQIEAGAVELRHVEIAQDEIVALVLDLLQRRHAVRRAVQPILLR